MYAKSGDIFDSRKMFDCMPERNVVTWNAMIGGYVRNGGMKTASALFEKMSTRTAVTWIEMIRGFTGSGDLVTARCMFDQVPPELKNVVTWTVMVDGYASKGLMIDARVLFEQMPERNFFSWSSMISGYCKIGDVEEARAIFDRFHLGTWRMEESNEKPDEITFLSVLSACAHGGFIDEGLEIFSKIDKCGLASSIKHYGCVVDLLGRAGRVQDAYEFIKRMPMKPNDAVWGALLGACRVHLDMDMVEQVMEEVRREDCSIDSGNDPHCVLLSNIFAASDSWEKAERMRMVMVTKGLPKTPGRSSVVLVNTQQ
ncbi:hypothetical protein GH714_021755 [Hevea brasiliensis]|uniref:Pentacotripeptide-repeat region of PRORP domain-containing protein n=1 Tax=Hevea brasiliensis TaxID=3981 RepID=A0A6A6M3H2_HEVBR|nr:hypothetical protein GH714_021755 [Hevea brasiliensis]